MLEKLVEHTQRGRIRWEAAHGEPVYRAQFNSATVEVGSDDDKPYFAVMKGENVLYHCDGELVSAIRTLLMYAQAFSFNTAEVVDGLMDELDELE